MAQAELIEEAKHAVRKEEEVMSRYIDLKGATGCRGKSTPVFLLPYTDASTLMEYPIAHCMALGLHKQFFYQMRDVLGVDNFISACKRADKRAAFLQRPSILKRPVKRILPEISTTLLSSYTCEDHQHGMESYHVLVFHR